KGGDRFFDEIEPYLCFVAIFLLGHPGWIFYILSLIILYLIMHLFYYFKGLVLSKSGGTQNIRIPLYNLWLPLALFVLLMNHFLLSRFFFWDLLSFN
ncbi:MAG: hypothetical protein KY053_00570, partial [Candidatus Liptonbacteria bacterium]|nr:hypothetical protein [Candidatus Liptonbacteria bacterium]